MPSPDELAEVVDGEVDADRLHDTSGALDAIFHAAPSRELRSRVETAAYESRPPLDGSGATSAAVAAHRDEHRRMAEVVASLDARDWDAMAVPRWELSVRDLVAHQAAAEALVAGVFGLDAAVPETEADPEPRTHAVVERFADDPPEQIAAELDRLTAMVSRHAAGLAPAELDRPCDYLLFDSCRDVLRYRAFETWTHRDDILVATNRSETVPVDASLREMGAVLPVGLPVAVAVADPSVSGLIRLTLEGSGGGTWDIQLGQPDDPIPSAWMRADMVEFCKLVAARRPPAAVAYEVEGRGELASILTDALADFAPM